MKKLILAMIIFPLSSYATETSLFLEDGYHPLKLENRLSFFITEKFNNDKKFEDGTMVFSMIQSDCKTTKYKKVPLEIYIPSTDSISKFYKNETESAIALQEQEYKSAPLPIVAITKKYCKS